MKSTHRQAARAKRHLVTTYGLLDTLFARPDAPMPEEKRRHQLTRMYGGLHALETAPAPTPDDWRVVSDAVNLMETLVKKVLAYFQGIGRTIEPARGNAEVTGA